MNSTELLALFRSEVRDDAAPYLWSDTEVFSYMDDAQKMFCRLGGGIADSTSAVTTLAVTAGDIFITISPLILKLRDVRVTSTGRIIDVLNFEDLNYANMYGTDYGRSYSYSLDASTGRIDAVVVGMEPNKIRLIRIPTEDESLSLITYRMPLNTINAVAQDFEIDEQHHRHLLYWMKHLAHQKQDAETYDRGRSDAFRAEFMAYCDQAKAERARREHKPRAVMYGGL